MDKFRKRVYQAEEAAYGNIYGTFFFDEDKTNISETDALDYIRGILSSSWWKKRWPFVNKLYVRFPKNPKMGGLSYTSKRLMNISSTCIKPFVISHELAHFGVPEVYEPHGFEFMGTYADIVRQFIGADEAEELEWCYTRQGLFDVVYPKPSPKVAKPKTVDVQWLRGRHPTHDQMKDFSEYGLHKAWRGGR